MTSVTEALRESVYAGVVWARVDAWDEARRIHGEVTPDRVVERLEDYGILDAETHVDAAFAEARHVWGNDWVWEPRDVADRVVARLSRADWEGELAWAA